MCLYQCSSARRFLARPVELEVSRLSFPSFAYCANDLRGGQIQTDSPHVERRPLRFRGSNDELLPVPAFNVDSSLSPCFFQNAGQVLPRLRIRINLHGSTSTICAPARRAASINPLSNEMRGQMSSRKKAATQVSIPLISGLHKNPARNARLAQIQGSQSL